MQTDPAVAPHPQLTPQDVVEAQLAALQHNDSANTGIKTAFRFASPANQEYTGPLEHFIVLVHNPLYSHLLNFQDATITETLVIEDQARLRVAVLDAADEEVAYIFALSRQSDPPYRNCWMTDGVQRIG